MKTFRNRHWAFKLLSIGAIALPLTLSLACTTNSVSDLVSGVNPAISTDPLDDPTNIPANYVTPSGVKLNPSLPFTMDTLNAVANQIPGENDVPWRYGITYEALSQTFSAARSLAQLMGWKESPSYTYEPKQLESSRGANTLYITDEDNANNIASSELNKAQQIKGNAENITRFLDNFRKLKVDDSNDAWANSFERSLGANYFLGDNRINETNLDNYLNSGVTNFRLATQGPQDVPFTDPYVQTIVKTNGDYANDHYLWSWSDYANPGEMQVAIRMAYREPSEDSSSYVSPGGYAVRLLRVKKPTITYPVIEQKLYESEFVPILRKLLDRFLEVMSPSTIAFARSFGATFAPDLESWINYLRDNLSSEFSNKFLIAAQALNNGSHHFLSIIALWKGLSSSFTKSPIWDFIWPGPSEPPLLVKWEKGKSLIGLNAVTETQDPASLLSNGFLYWFRFPNQSIKKAPANVYPYDSGSDFELYFKDFPQVENYVYSAYFTNRATAQDLALANRAVIYKRNKPSANSQSSAPVLGDENATN